MGNTLQPWYIVPWEKMNLYRDNIRFMMMEGQIGEDFRDKVFSKFSRYNGIRSIYIGRVNDGEFPMESPRYHLQFIRRDGMLYVTHEDASIISMNENNSNKNKTKLWINNEERPLSDVLNSAPNRLSMQGFEPIKEYISSLARQIECD